MVYGATRIVLYQGLNVLQATDTENKIQPSSSFHQRDRDRPYGLLAGDVVSTV